MRLSDFDAQRAAGLFRELESEAAGFVRSCDANAEILAEYKVYMRYSGQGWEIPVTLSASDATAAKEETFKNLF